MSLEDGGRSRALPILGDEGPQFPRSIREVATKLPGTDGNGVDAPTVKAVKQRWVHGFQSVPHVSNPGGDCSREGGGVVTIVQNGKGIAEAASLTNESLHLTPFRLMPCVRPVPESRNQYAGGKEEEERRNNPERPDNRWGPIVGHDGEGQKGSAGSKRRYRECELPAILGSMNSGRITRLIGERKQLVGLVFLLAASTLILARANAWLAVAFIGLNFLFYGALGPLVNSMINNRTESQHRATVLSITSLCGSLLLVPAQPLFGLFAQTWGLDAGFGLVAALLLITTLAAVGTVRLLSRCEDN